MKITFYDTQMDGLRTVLVKEKSVNYPSMDRSDKLNIPVKAAKLVDDVTGISKKAEEHLYMLALDTKCHLIGLFFLSKGTISQAATGAREIFMLALMAGASCIILCHNHPSGDTEPSINDIRTTDMLTDAGKLIGIPVIDHIIIGSGGNYYSFHEKKTTEKEKEKNNAEI